MRGKLADVMSYLNCVTAPHCKAIIKYHILCKFGMQLQICIIFMSKFHPLRLNS